MIKQAVDRVIDLKPELLFTEVLLASTLEVVLLVGFIEALPPRVPLAAVSSIGAEETNGHPSPSKPSQLYPNERASGIEEVRDWLAYW